MITASLCGFEIEGELGLISFWPFGAGDLPDGGFDVEAWEAAQTHICAVRGVPLREAWKAAYRVLRIKARKSGGLEWLDMRLVDEEPCPLPDRKVVDPFWGVPRRTLWDNGSSFCPASHPAMEALMQGGSQQTHNNAR